MKRLSTIAFALCAAISFVLLAGCAKEQSSLTIDQLPESAKIVGRFTYDEGQSYSGGKYQRLVKPAAYVDVVVTVPVSEICDGNAEGVITYETTTDYDGRYEITIPVTTTGMTVEVKPVDFVGKYTTVVDVKNGAPVYAKDEVVFTADSKFVNVGPKDIKVVDGLYEHVTMQLGDGYPVISTFQILVGEATYYKTKDEDGEYVVTKEYKPVYGANLIASVQYDDVTMKFAAATDSEGYATFRIPAKEQTWSPYVSVHVKSYEKTSFRYYVREYDSYYGEYEVNSYTISNGYYEQASSVARNIEFDDSQEIYIPVYKIKMNYHPFIGVETYGYSESEWNSVSF